MSTAPASATLQLRRLIRAPREHAFAASPACRPTCAWAASIASICAPPFDIPEVGRSAVVQDPQGARFGLFQPGC